MIAKLAGRVDGVGRDFAVVDVAGVGYLVHCSGRTLARLSPGAGASLRIETFIREDRIQLYGFADAEEQQWFRLLTTVQGVGSKVALAILSALGVDELARAVAAGDRAALSRAFGVGGKLAGRIASELKDKVVGLLPGGGPAAAVAAGGRAAAGLPADVADAVSALVNLGFQPSEALQAVSRAAGELGGRPPLEALIRGALAGLGRGAHGAARAGLGA
jgi:Holliday junction DNA helicase RuvA